VARNLSTLLPAVPLRVYAVCIPLFVWLLLLLYRRLSRASSLPSSRCRVHKRSWCGAHGVFGAVGRGHGRVWWWWPDATATYVVQLVPVDPAALSLLRTYPPYSLLQRFRVVEKCQSDPSLRPSPANARGPAVRIGRAT
jgi:hypothetical protein